MLLKIPCLTQVLKKMIVSSRKGNKIDTSVTFETYQLSKETAYKVKGEIELPQDAYKSWSSFG